MRGSSAREHGLGAPRETQIRMANAGTIVSRGSSCPLSYHGPSERLPRLSCVCGMAAPAQESSAPHGEQPTESACLWGEGTHTPQSPETALWREGELGKAAPRTRDTQEPVSWREAHLQAGALRAQERGSSLPKDFSWAQLQVRSALGEEPRVSVLASTCLGCSENPMHQTSKYLW